MMEMLVQVGITTAASAHSVHHQVFKRIALCLLC